MNKLSERNLNPVEENDALKQKIKELEKSLLESMRSKEILQESGEAFLKFFKNHAAVQYVIDLDTGAVVNANHAAADFYGWPREKLTQMSIQQINIKTSDEIKEAMKNAWNGSQAHFEFQHRLADGSIRNVEVFRSRAIVHGKKYLHCIIYDITEHKRIEETLVENESLYRNLFENAAIGMFQSTLEGRFLRINKAYATMLGYASQEEVISNITDTATQIHTDPRNRAELLAALEQQGWFYAEQPYFRKDGSIMIGKLAVRKVVKQDGTTAYLEGIVEDITEQKLREEKLRAAEEKYHSIFDNAVEGIFQSTIGGTLISVNPSMARLYGYNSPEHMITSLNCVCKNLYVNPKDLEECILLLSKNGEIQGFESRHYRMDGKIIWCSLNARNVYDKSGIHSHIEGTVVDISIRKQIEEELRMQREDLERQTIELQDMNTTLRVLIEKRNDDKRTMEDKILHNIQNLIMPHLERLKTARLTPEQIVHVLSLEENLNTILSSYFIKLKESRISLTPREIEIANRIKMGKSTKEIATALNVTEATVERHRKHLRRKLGIAKEKVGLQHFLSSRMY